jgi:AcrR family transcriptional regulator
MLDAAESLFATRAFTSVRIEDVAEAADVSVGSVYMHFHNKEGLMAAVAERTLERAADAIGAAFRASASPLEAIEASGQAYMRLLLDHPVLIRYMTTDSLSNELPTMEEHIFETVAFLRDAFANLIEAAIEAGQVRPVDSKLAAQFVFGAWNGVAALTLQKGPMALTSEEAEQCLTLGQRAISLGMTRVDVD